MGEQTRNKYFPVGFNVDSPDVKVKERMSGMLPQNIGFCCCATPRGALTKARPIVRCKEEQEVREERDIELTQK